jgi:hypothetical protein
MADYREQPMSERGGWVLLAISAAVLALDWLALVFLAYAYGTQLGERLFQ